MSKNLTSWTIKIILLSAFYAASIASAQESIPCKVVKDYGDGTYFVRINGKDLLAIPDEMQKRILKQRVDLLSTQKEMALKDSLLAKYDLAKAWYDTTLKNQKEYIAELEDVLDDYKRLVKDLKKLKGEPWFTLSGGVGATGDDTDPAILMGLGLRRFRVWGLLQENNSGVIVGTTLPLF
jgi:hypothetical protein